MCRKILLIQPACIYEQRTNLIGLYLSGGGGGIFGMLIGLHIWGAYIWGAYIRGSVLTGFYGILKHINR